MRALKAVFLLLVFCAQMGMFTMERAYCSGKLVKIELNGKPRICHCDHEEVHAESDEAGVTRIPCCTSETIEKQFKNLVDSDELIVAPLLPLRIAHHNLAEVILYSQRDIRLITAVPPPPKRKVKPFILFGNFKSESCGA